MKIEIIDYNLCLDGKITPVDYQLLDKMLEIRIAAERKLYASEGTELRIYVHGVYAGPPYNFDSPTKII